MAGRGIKTKVCTLVLAAAVVGTNANAGPSGPSSGQVLPPPKGPEITTQADRQHVGMTAVHKGLVVRTTRSRADRTLDIDVQYRNDRVRISLDREGATTVTRNRNQLRIDSPEALQELQQLLGGSEAIVVFRMLLAERESVSDLQAPEYTILAAAAFTASLVGDTDAPRRLSDRFVQKHRGIFRLVSAGRGCWDNYSQATTSAWNTLQDCMNEANQDENPFRGAYRRLACNAIWLLEAESAWFEYLSCLNPASISG